MDTDELMRRTEEQDREQYRAEREERDACESVEAEVAHWEGVMRAMSWCARHSNYAGGPG